MHYLTDRVVHTTAYVIPVVGHWITKNGSVDQPRGIDPMTYRTMRRVMSHFLSYKDVHTTIVETSVNRLLERQIAYETYRLGSILMPSSEVVWRYNKHLNIYYVRCFINNTKMSYLIIYKGLINTFYD